jgi:NAD(P)-dependent dehydrogenase (short-subunit alcohol dehydrogenase family)
MASSDLPGSTNPSILMRSTGDSQPRQAACYRLEDRFAFITGGGAGLGEATAIRLSDEGARVAVVDINGAEADRVAAGIPGALSLQVDVTDGTAVERAIATTVQHFGKIDIIFNNAGIAGEQQALHEYTDENWRAVNALNGDGVFYVLKHGIAAMLKSGGGSIINTSSTAALTAQLNISAYSYSKAGVTGITRSAAVEYAKQGIRVNAIAPTAVLTPMVEAFIEASDDPEGFRAERENWNPIPGWPVAEDVAAVVAFLASDDARWITGHTLPMDGGYVVR